MSLEVLYERCAGIDVHQRFVVVCLLVAEGGKRRQESRTFRNETADLLALRTYLGERYRRLKKRRGSKRAALAIGHDILVIYCQMMKNRAGLSGERRGVFPATGSPED